MDPQPTQPQSQAPIPTPSVNLSRFAGIKALVIKVLIGCLIAAAALSVTAVLIGGFNDTLTKAIITLVLVAAHSIAALGYINTSEKNNEDDLAVFHNAVFTVIVLSFITSVGGTWEVISSDLLGKLYATYLVVLFAILHGEMLAKTRGKTNTINNIVLANYGFMAIVVVLILMVIYVGTEMLEGFYGRFLAAMGIIDATLTILAVALHRLYLNKHPELAEPQPGKPRRKGLSILLILLLAYLAFQLVISLVFSIGRLGY